MEQNKNYNKESNNPLAFFYEPSIYMKNVWDYTDTWYMDRDIWKKSKLYSLSLGIEVME
ncbi:hypothetical protein [Flavobacterium sp.]|uniref:hypothetical protein n=1 Tax=Flavobacterium sp. TaxID=239 RepID=UPI0025F3DC63|nr:hypothetical protein [Flavobacterium sp.]